jgi:hypothetical protein
MYTNPVYVMRRKRRYGKFLAVVLLLTTIAIAGSSLYSFPKSSGQTRLTSTTDADHASPPQPPILFVRDLHDGQEGYIASHAVHFDPDRWWIETSARVEPEPSPAAPIHIRVLGGQFFLLQQDLLALRDPRPLLFDPMTPDPAPLKPDIANPNPASQS